MNTPARLLSRMAVALLATAAVSCDVHEYPEKPAPPMPATEVTLHFADGDMPLLTTVEYDAARRRSRADAGDDARFTIRVYPVDAAEGSRSPSRTPSAVTVITDDASAATDDRTVALKLDPGCYRVIAWADYVDAGSQADKYYFTGTFPDISLLSRAGAADSQYLHWGDTPQRDAFRGETLLHVAADGTLTDADGTMLSAGRAIVPMHRPLARFCFITTDLREFISRRPQVPGAPAHALAPDLADYRAVLRYTSYMPSTYNARTDKPVDARTGVFFDGDITRLSTDEARLGSDYVLVNGASTSVQVALDVYSRTDGALIASTAPIDIPLQRNRLTLVRGRFLTTTSGTGMGIDPGFSGDINIEIH